MTRGPFIGGGDDLIRAPYVPDAKHIRHDSNSASMQAGSNTSPGLFVSVVAGSHGGEKTPFSFHASGASFERGSISQTLLDVAALIVVPLYLLLYLTVILGLIPFAFFCLFLVSFH